MTCMLVLLGPLLMAAEPAPKAEETTTFNRKGQVTVFGGDCRLKRTRTEVLLDIDPNPPDTSGPMKARTRLILTPFTAKRLQAALRTTTQRHEATFGAVEAPEAKQAKNDTVARKSGSQRLLSVLVEAFYRGIAAFRLLIPL